LEGGPPSFPQTHRGSWYSGCQSDHADGLATGLSPSLARHSSLLAYIPADRAAGPTTPAHPRMAWFGLLPVRSPLLGESRLISFRQATEMFQFAHLPPSCLWVQQAVSRHHSGGVAPFGLSGLMACMQLPRNVSPVSASFIGLQRQGIHPVLCRACPLDKSIHLSAGSHQQRWIGVMMCSFVLLCFAFAGVFSAKSK
jgi:hypothetical protein